MENLRNLYKIVRCILKSNKVCRNNRNLSYKYIKNVPRILFITCNNKNFTSKATLQAFLAINVLKWLGFEEADEEKQSELIMTIKRAVLCMNREQYDKAEQMLHLALHMAQQQQNYQGIVYCYDLMANLAMERYELKKAEKLFVSVMQLLLSSGEKEDDIKMIHISLKLARINHLLAEESKAEIGYNWCLEKIQKHQNRSEDDKILYGVIRDWYSQFLLDQGRVNESIVHLKEAYNISLQVKGYNNEQNLLLLNDLGITSWRAGDLEGAYNFLTQAETMGKSIEDKTHLGIVKANLGLIYLEKGLKDEAQKQCKEAWQLGKRYENTESIDQANYCFEQIKMFMNK